MAFNCKYLVIDTGYVSNVDEEFLQDLYNMCEDITAKPLFSFSISNSFEVNYQRFVEENETFSVDKEMTALDVEIINKLINASIITRGSLVFEVDSFDTAKTIFLKGIRDMDYCAIYDMTDIQLLQELVYVSYDTECG